MFDKLDHIGIVVEDLSVAVQRYTKLFGFTLFEEEDVPEQGMKIAVVRLGELNIELLQSTSEDGTLAGFLRKRGPGFHHMAYKVENIREELYEVRKEGIRVIDKEPRTGSGGKLISFLHPKDTEGVLIEFCQDQ